MDVKAENLLFESVLTKGKYIIPDYQREFDWDDAEIDVFIEDIQDTKEGEKYFIGHMVFEGDFNGQEFFVIDGQQRITTVTILLCVIRDLLHARKDFKLANALHEKYIFNKDRNGEQYAVLRNDNPYPILQSYVQSKPDDKIENPKPTKSGEQKIILAYDKFFSLYKTINNKELLKLRDKLLKLEIIFVAVKDSDPGEQVDAHEIFMTLNATGKDLTALDLIKSRIFKLYPKQPHVKQPSDGWKELISNTDRKQNKFLNNFWSSRFRKVADYRIFKEFVKDVIKPKKDIKLFFQEFLADSRIFKKINNPQRGDWSNNEEFRAFFSINAIVNIFDVEVANSILISLVREYQNKRISFKYFLKGLTAIERFHFINNAICSFRSSGLDTMYSRFARDLITSKSKSERHSKIDELIRKLIQKLPNRDEFSAKFDEKLFYLSTKTKQKSLVSYALKKLEYKKNSNVELINVSIEHIYPENIEKGSSKLPPEQIGNIGNLCLLDKDLNSNDKVGNKKYELKKKLVNQSSHLVTTKEIFKASVWNEKSIIKRKKKLLDQLYDEAWR